MFALSKKIKAFNSEKLEALGSFETVTEAQSVMFDDMDEEEANGYCNDFYFIRHWNPDSDLRNEARITFVKVDEDYDESYDYEVEYCISERS